MNENQRIFIEHVGAIAATDMKWSGILASVTIAQAILESGWGSSALATQANALFGIKADKRWSGRTYSIQTTEWYDGKNPVVITDTFRAYDSWTASVTDHSKFLTTSARYSAVIGEQNPVIACQALYRAGYSTDPQYAEKLAKLIAQYNLAVYDKGGKSPMAIHIKSCNPANYGGNRTSTSFIVVHYTANHGDTAKNNADYFARESVGASAHYFVDESQIWESVPENQVAWHCGAKTYRHPKCRNTNSIGVEICMLDKAGKVRQGSIDNAAQLVRELMRKYKIPVQNVLRHYDVTGKNCPVPMVKDTALWNHFQSQLTTPPTQKEEEQMKVYRHTADMPDWAQNTFRRLIDAKIVNVDSKGEIAVQESSLQPMVYLDRLCGGKIEELPKLAGKK